MSDFRFAEPQFAQVFWAVLAFVVLLFWLDRRGGSALERVVRGVLQDRLVERPSSWRRTLRIVLIGLSCACAVLALMRPQWGMRVVSSSRVGAEIMVALDVSRSMLAEDVAPNRLERAKAELVDLLSYMDGDQVGLIAFAGRASVLCPLTPDFGFLRMVLEGTSPRSVMRGGTRLAEPIRKAVAGFGPSEGASRAILLITDGEDHDSFALDAAKEAALAGVKIIAIGFGDEDGSEIRVTDPRTGAAQLVRDADGRPVVSRLDGETLRELALATGGAYVPAGTGVLDLESIYDQHIARLTRGEMDGQRAVRDEGYPWFVLLSLIFLVGSATVSAGRLVRGAVAVGALAFAFSVGAPVAQAQAPDPNGAPRDVPEEASGGDADASSEANAAASVPDDPRELYNRGVAAIESRDLDDAERLLERARRIARDDDTLRFHASYNLGCVSVDQAGRVRGEAPQRALEYFYRAADWFREAVRLRPEDEAARHNLEVTLRSALVLADEIAKASEGGVEGALRELVERQRTIVGSVAGLLETDEDAAPAAMQGVDRLRGEFHARATAQRGVLADTDQLAARVGGERDALAARPEEERTPEDRMREVQLAGVLDYLHRSRERMGQARRQLRRRQAERAYRRTSAALVELKRAQDQLRDPVAVLDQLLKDGAELARSTAYLSLVERNVPGLAGETPRVPAWLNVESLADGQTSLAERSEELHRRLLAGLEQGGSGAEEEGMSGPEAELLAAVREAEPFVGEGHEHAASAATALAAGDLATAPEEQHASLRALGAARERFLDLRGLIEATHAEEKRIEGVLSAEGEEAAAARLEFLPSLQTAQAENVDRAERLARKLEAEYLEQRLAAEQQTGDAPGGGAAPDSETREAMEAQLKHLDVATQLLTLALSGMEEAQQGLGAASSVEAPAAGATAEVDWKRAQAGVETAVQHLTALRRLFFSIVEHVRELAREQMDLADSTQDALALSADPAVDASERAAPLVASQRLLAEQGLAVANALQEQSNAAGGVAAEDPQAEDATRRLREAGEHVLLAQGEMEQATQGLEEPADLASARAAQDRALLELREALAILEPPQEQPPGDPQQDQQQQGQQQQQQQQQQEAGGDEEQKAEPPSRDQDPAQLLQEVRDREAQRRRDNARRSAGYETVEKDW